jgi:hypothetical protein
VRYRQTDADFRGIELELGWTALRGDGWTWQLDGRAVSWAEQRGAGTAAIPPVPTVGTTADFGRLTLRGEIRARCARTAPRPAKPDRRLHLVPNIAAAVANETGLACKDATSATPGRNRLALKDVTPLRGRGDCGGAG